MSRHTTPLNPTRRGFGALALGTLAAAGTASALGSSAAQAAPAASAAPAAPTADGPQPTPHTQQAYDPIASDFHARWTRADARQVMLYIVLFGKVAARVSHQNKLSCHSIDSSLFFQNRLSPCSTENYTQRKLICQSVVPPSR